MDSHSKQNRRCFGVFTRGTAVWRLLAAWLGLSESGKGNAAVFAMPFYTKTHLFTKTGSGQTQGKSNYSQANFSNFHCYRPEHYPKGYAMSNNTHLDFHGAKRFTHIFCDAILWVK
jgi:hypothetical protein